MIDIDNNAKDNQGNSEYYHKGGIQSVLQPRKEKSSDLSMLLDKMQLEKVGEADTPTIIEEDDDEVEPVAN